MRTTKRITASRASPRAEPCAGPCAVPFHTWGFARGPAYCCCTLWSPYLRRPLCNLAPAATTLLISPAPTAAHGDHGRIYKYRVKFTSDYRPAPKRMRTGNLISTPCVLTLLTGANSPRHIQFLVHGATLRGRCAAVGTLPPTTGPDRRPRAESQSSVHQFSILRREHGFHIYFKKPAHQWARRGERLRPRAGAPASA
jgi:hypothetical protein